MVIRERDNTIEIRCLEVLPSYSLGARDAQFHVRVSSRGYPPWFRTGLARFREVEPDRPVVCVFEDIDATIKQYGDNELLQSCN